MTQWWPGTNRRALRTGTFKMSVDVKLTLQFTSGWRPFLRQQVVNIHIDWNTQLSINGYTHIIRCVNKTALLMLVSSECYGGVFLFFVCLMDIFWLFRSHFVFCNKCVGLNFWPVNFFTFSLNMAQRLIWLEQWTWAMCACVCVCVCVCVCSVYGTVHNSMGTAVCVAKTHVQVAAAQGLRQMRAAAHHLRGAAWRQADQEDRSVCSRTCLFSSCNHSDAKLFRLNLICIKTLSLISQIIIVGRPQGLVVCTGTFWERGQFSGRTSDLWSEGNEVDSSSGRRIYFSMIRLLSRLVFWCPFQESGIFIHPQ